MTPEEQAEQDRLIAEARAAAEQAGRTAGATERQAQIDAYLADQAAEAERANMAEADRLRSERDAARAQAEQAQATAAADRLAITVERQLLAAGVPDSALARAARMVNLDLGADDAAITAEVEALKAEVPALFVTDQVPAPAPPPGGGTPPPKPPAPRGTGQTPQERAAARHAALTKTRPGATPAAA